MTYEHNPQAKTANRKPQTGLAISPGQIRAIKSMARRVFRSDEEYREALWAQCRVRSCKELKGAKIEFFIRYLKKCLGQGQERTGNGGPKTEDRRPETGGLNREMRYILRLWDRVSRAPEAERARALRHFLKNRFGVEEVRWLNPDTTWRVIEALKAMAARAPQ